MKKVGWLLVCVMMLLTLAVPVHATDILPENTESQVITDPSATQPATEPTQSATEATQSTTEPTQPATEATQPTTEQTQPSTEATQPVTESTQPPHEHGWGEGKITTAVTCTAPGIRTYTCSCGKTKTEEIAASGHTFGDWETAAEKHVRVCGGCAVREEAVHTFGVWQDKGVDHSKTCTTCSHTVTENHKWSSSTVLKKPTCKESGVLGYVCSSCNAILEETIDKLKVHTYDSACDSECNVCGIKRDVEHDFEEVWVRDASGHWYACTKCDEKVAFSKHNPGPEATEEREQLCSTCKYVINPKKKHVHAFEKKWTTDEAGHWHACKSCDAEDGYKAHVYDNVCDSDCNICEYDKGKGHTYGEDWKTSRWEHWQICTVCSEESKHQKHIPGPEATEQAPQLCNVCDFELAPTQIHTHDFSDNWEWDTVNHWQLCSCGETSVEMEHTWDHGREVRKDVLEFSCIQCDATKLERKESGFPWVILLVILALGCLGGIAVLVVMLKRGKFEEEAETDADDSGDSEAVTDALEEEPAEEIPLELSEPEEDAEIDMIDAFFASLDKE